MFMGKEGNSAETALQKLHEQYNGYKYLEQRLTSRKIKLRVQIPDIEKTLGVVQGMKRAQVGPRAACGWTPRPSYTCGSAASDLLPFTARAATALRSLPRAAQTEGEESIKMHFELSDAVYAKADVPVAAEQPVFLWLGANVMLEYPLDDAVTLLQNNLATAEKALGEIVADLSFLKDQMTTSEVNIARVYNWDVRERRKKEAAGETTS